MDRSCTPSRRHLARVSLLLASGLSLAACATVQPQYAVRPDGAQGPFPQTSSGAGRYKVGAPYQINGQWYYPAEQPNYDETGLASWYGDAFHGKPTANAEVFDMYAPSAAHKTLPLPSVVEVTNLDNGRSMQLRVNDRGPFVEGRIIDLSRGAAEELGVIQSGTARVRVRYVGQAPLETRPAGPAQVASSPVAAAAFSTQYQPQPVPAAGPDISQSELPPLTQPAAGPIVQAASPPVASGAYQVQAGAFGDLANAERVATALADTGMVEIQPVQRNGATLYRVMIRDIADQTQAGIVRDKVVQIGLADARIIMPN